MTTTPWRLAGQCWTWTEAGHSGEAAFSRFFFPSRKELSQEPCPALSVRVTSLIEDTTPEAPEDLSRGRAYKPRPPRTTHDTALSS
ncbi:hypothetical protein CEP52_013527 [Fusarium oligoseptatum]|uniref:Uncharacterized protein n=2 Tax=Fusarium solani species complex TaxID=232080 RepID=A0A428ST36_9HYPO|nr:hypothetical protein CEP51_006996 [Fusarium floridanum]RSL92954.1 hypothetical protein CEP52_013527 [Fusarium oligoseptatum]